MLFPMTEIRNLEFYSTLFNFLSNNTITFNKSDVANVVHAAVPWRKMTPLVNKS